MIWLIKHYMSLGEITGLKKNKKQQQQNKQKTSVENW